MAHRLYSYQGQATDWKIKDERLSPPALIPKWEKWTHANTHSPAQIIEGLRERIAELETERENEGPHGPYNHAE